MVTVAESYTDVNVALHNYFEGNTGNINVRVAVGEGIPVDQEGSGS